MSYHVHPRELEAVSKLPANDRYQYFINKVADWKEVWSVKDKGGWALMGDTKQNECVPVWPAEAFAKDFCSGDWEGRHAQCISLEDWLEKWTPGMTKDGRRVAVFPAPNCQGVVVEADRLAADIKEIVADLE